MGAVRLRGARHIWGGPGRVLRCAPGVARAYHDNRASANSTALDESLIAALVRQIAREAGFEGTTIRRERGLPEDHPRQENDHGRRSLAAGLER